MNSYICAYWLMVVKTVLLGGFIVMPQVIYAETV